MVVGCQALLPQLLGTSDPITNEQKWIFLSQFLALVVKYLSTALKCTAYLQLLLLNRKSWLPSTLGILCHQLYIKMSLTLKGKGDCPAFTHFC